MADFISNDLFCQLAKPADLMAHEGYADLHGQGAEVDVTMSPELGGATWQNPLS
jgi:hypothetical protein